MDVAKGDLGRFVDDELFAGRDRVNKQQALNAATSRRLDPSAIKAIEKMPDGEYAHDEFVVQLEAVVGGSLRSTFGV